MIPELQNRISELEKGYKQLHEKLAQLQEQHFNLERELGLSKPTALNKLSELPKETCGRETLLRDLPY